MIVYTPYPRYAVYPVPYLRFLTVYGPYLQVVHPRLGFNSLQKRFLLFLVQIFFSRLFELSIPLTSYLLICMYLH